MFSKNWADIEDDDHLETTDVRLGVDSAPRKRGPGEDVRVEVQYTEREGKAVKITTTYKQKQMVTKSNKHIEERKLNWKPFGRCHDPLLYADYGSNKPIRAEENVVLEMNREKQMKAAGQEEKFYEQSIMVCDSILNEVKKKKYDANEMRRKKEEEMKDLAAGGIIATGGAMSSMAGKYVPPSMRAGGDTTMQNDRSQENTLRVMGLSEDTREGDVQHLFAAFGPTQRCFMPRHKEGEREGMHKGFAFVSFRDRKVAEAAMKKLHGHGYDSLILSISWAQPRAPPP